MNINPMRKAHAAPRCGAFARTTGAPCKGPAMANGRCRMHGGKSPGAQEGKANGNYRHGRRTRERILGRRELKTLGRKMSESATALDMLIYQFQQSAHDLGVSMGELFELCSRKDGRLEMLVVEFVKRHTDSTGRMDEKLESLTESINALAQSTAAVHVDLVGVRDRLDPAIHAFIGTP